MLYLNPLPLHLCKSPPPPLKAALYELLVNSRQQEEREIRHKLKKGEIDDIPRDVLDTFPSLLSAPAKGTYKSQLSL